MTTKTSYFEFSSAKCFFLYLVVKIKQNTQNSIVTPSYINYVEQKVLHSLDLRGTLYFQ